MKISIATLTATAVLMLALPAGAALARTVVVETHGGGHHNYIYYPGHRIYYEPAARSWFWFDGGVWRFGAVLPVYYEQFTTGGVSVSLDVARPYVRQDWVEAHYGRPVVIVNRHDARGHEYRRDYNHGYSGGHSGHGHDRDNGHGHGHGHDRGHH